MSTTNICDDCLHINNLLCQKHGPHTILENIAEDEEEEIVLSVCPDCIEESILSFTQIEIVAQATYIREILEPKLVAEFETGPHPIKSDDPNVRLLFTVMILSNLYNLSIEETLCGLTITKEYSS